MLITAFLYQKSIKSASQRSDRTVAYTSQLSSECIETFCISLLLIEVLNIFQTWLVKKRHIFLPWKDLFKGWRMFLHPTFSQHHLLITPTFWSTRTLFFLWSSPSCAGSHLSAARGGTEIDIKSIPPPPFTLRLCGYTCIGIYFQTLFSICCVVLVLNVCATV